MKALSQNKLKWLLRTARITTLIGVIALAIFTLDTCAIVPFFLYVHNPEYVFYSSVLCVISAATSFVFIMTGACIGHKYFGWELNDTSRKQW